MTRLNAIISNIGDFVIIAKYMSFYTNMYILLIKLLLMKCIILLM